ncbi:DUF512 domain-containing protein [candidate division KSB1 bacterium]|nr:DUF512 domain-containing protein [candidate division KSB1 bacterium]
MIVIFSCSILLNKAVFLPKSCLNDKQIFLDDWKLTEMQERLGVPVVPLKNDFSGIFEFLKFGRVAAFEEVKSFEAEPDVAS